MGGIRRIFFLVFFLVLLGIYKTPSYAGENEMGFFGGISEGDYLPKTIEKYVDFGNTNNVYDYKEMVFISGVPTEVRGTITVTVDRSGLATSDTGLFTETYVVDAASSDGTTVLARSVSLTTGYRYIDVGANASRSQLSLTSVVDSWTETITTASTTFTLDPDTITFSKTTIEDITPGVTYYNTTLSLQGTFYDSEGNEVTYALASDDGIYGYRQPWSKIETQYLNMSLYCEALDLNMDIELNPRLEAKKTIYYDETQPFPISFGGTYNQRMEREASLTYTIHTYHPELTQSQLSASILLTTANEIEKLPIPEGLDFIEGHWAEDDIKKLYSMEIFTSTPHEGMQYEAMSRGEFVKALCLAMDIDTSDYMDASADSPQIFGDVTYDSPLYPYIMGAYDAKLVKGTGADFQVSKPITREEAFVIYIRVIGLERLGITESPITPFVDDDNISSWAKQEIMAGYNLGIIQGNSLGQVLPKQWISKAEAAAIINRLVDYLREEIGVDY